MDGQQVRAWEAQCIQEQPPACTATCPVQVDVRQLSDCVRRGDFASGFAVLARSVPFPGIISRICDHPCEPACKLRDIGDPLKIRELEQACTDYGYSLIAPAMLPSREKRVAIVGGGLSGLTAAVELAIKGYAVVVFEAKPRLLDRILNLKKEVLPHSVAFADLALLPKLGIEIRTATWVSSAQCHALTEDFDAIYLGPGPEPLDAGMDIALRPNGFIAIDPLTLATSHPKVFAGGTHRNRHGSYSPIMSLQDGKSAAVSVDRFLQGASLTASREHLGAFVTRLFVNTTGLAPSRAGAATGEGFTKDEALREAARCLPCNCLECVKVCEYLAHFKSYPKRYVREIYNNDCIVLGNHPSNRLINSCSLCGLCAAVCPENLSMGEVCLEARQSMVRKGKMPPAAHDFALRDMAFSRSEAFLLARHQPGFATSEAVFFPGCQLSASSPNQVVQVYEYLCNHIAGGVGLILGCCGAPAYWSGEKTLFHAVLKSLREETVRMGNPRILTACSSCFRMLEDYVPGLQVESLWTLLDHEGIKLDGMPKFAGSLAIHDPCTTRNERPIQDSVRNVLKKTGANVIELNERGLTTCCGYGGLMQFVNAEVADKVVNRRIKQSDADFVTYCAMCRDNFARRGKRTLHILDLLFPADGGDPAARADPGFSMRQENRARLKMKLLRELWREPVPEDEEKLKLDISPEILARLEKRMILLEDVRKVIAHAEATGQKLWNPQTHRFLASYRPAAVTYWVEYTIQQENFVVHNAYSHRMEVS
ncbi:MAG TPA: heterodisulfide reductase-related iron-sulfur binding cluster [Dongiaceae bacterium]|nr:heterodisulfide reductase-related iron-sulfur binding cluster [Dongiaceae bacterium]